ncbi:hypothetical protein HGM15179_011296, partial [Zosterops borbonicus]
CEDQNGYGLTSLNLLATLFLMHCTAPLTLLATKAHDILKFRLTAMSSENSNEL